jgi:hypothetical protein
MKYKVITREYNDHVYVGITDEKGRSQGFFQIEDGNWAFYGCDADEKIDHGSMLFCKLAPADYEATF